MVQLLSRQLRAYTDALGERPAAPPGRGVGRPGDFDEYDDLREAVATAVSLWRLLLDRRDRIQRAGRDRAITGERWGEEMMATNDLFMDWFIPSRGLLDRLDAAGAAGAEVAGADEFRRFCRETHIPEFGADRLARAEQESREGRGRPLKEVVDELLRRAGRSRPE